MKSREYRKIMVGGRKLDVIIVKFKEVDGEVVERIPSFALKFLEKEGCEFLPATVSEFQENYVSKYGEPVEVNL